MKIANYKNQTYEFTQLSEKENTLLLSNEWQPGFHVKKQDENTVYYLTVPKEDISKEMDLNIEIVLQKKGKHYTVDSVEDTCVGEFVVFNKDNPIIPKLDNMEEINGKYYISIDALADKYQDMQFFLSSEDLYDGSVSCQALTVIEAIGYSVQMANISSNTKILTCRFCQNSYSIKNSGISIGDTYQAVCPACKKANTERRY